MRVALALLALAGCAELGVISDGTSISVGKPSRGHLIDGSRLPDRGEGFTTRRRGAIAATGTGPTSSSI